jgi:hypothetical protein
MEKKQLIVCLGAALLVSLPWQAQAQVQVFHSVQSANLPTAETLLKGDWLFEISHRFQLPVSSGAGELWGLDGGASLRLGLTYAVSDRTMVGVLRSNFEDNLEFNAKFGIYERGYETLPFKLAAMTGVAWNTDPVLVEGAEDNEVQWYAQLLINTLVADRLAIGVVPTYLRNPRIRDSETNNAFALGLHGQIYVSRSISFLAEWILSGAQEENPYDGGTFGVEFETRGHFFKIVLTNQTKLNPTQFLVGTPFSFHPDEWRLGFNITRILPF